MRWCPGFFIRATWLGMDIFCGNSCVIMFGCPLRDMRFLLVCPVDPPSHINMYLSYGQYVLESIADSVLHWSFWKNRSAGNSGNTSWPGRYVTSRDLTLYVFELRAWACCIRTRICLFTSFLRSAGGNTSTSPVGRSFRARTNSYDPACWTICLPKTT